MKNVGSYFEYEEARNADLLRAFKQQLEGNKGYPVSRIYKIIVEMPSKRFWVSEERAAIVMSYMIRGVETGIRSALKKEMYEEIYARLCKAREQNPNESIYNLTFDIVNGPAPKFYLTPDSAKVIIGKINRKWYEERKHKRLL